MVTLQTFSEMIRVGSLLREWLMPGIPLRKRFRGSRTQEFLIKGGRRHRPRRRRCCFHRSGTPYPDPELEGYKLGVNSYIQKPADFEQFRNVVKETGLYWLVVNQPPPPKAFSS